MKNHIAVNEAQFTVGDKVRHDLFDYRGIVLDIDPSFQHSEEWYEKMAKTMPSKDSPWYHVLVHGTSHITYVAEQNLRKDVSADQIEHPAIEFCFDLDPQGHYHRRGLVQ